ncbi:MAG: class I SAM-dependent methyltransferase [Planctomycetes bacterium]|nr:class I SAM-dependent methyltransferase [Planctomycetota bacterium]
MSSRSARAAQEPFPPFRIDPRDVKTEHVSCAVCGGDRPRPYRPRMYSVAGVPFHLVRCPCGMVYLDPRPDGPTLGRMYSDPAYYTEGYNLGVETENYFDRKDELVLQYTETARALADELGGKGELLELGSAGGFFLEGARRAGFSVRGVELSAPAADYARRELGLDVFEGWLEHAPWQDGSFDVAYADNVLEHTTDPLGTLRKLRALLKPDGHLVVVVPSYVNSPWFRALLLAQRVLPRKLLGQELVRILKLDPDRDSGHPYHILEFDRATLSRLVRAAGFEIVTVAGSVPLPAHLFKVARRDVKTRLLRGVFRMLDFGMRRRLLPAARLRFLLRRRAT